MNKYLSSCMIICFVSACSFYEARSDQTDSFEGKELSNDDVKIYERQNDALSFNTTHSDSFEVVTSKASYAKNKTQKEKGKLKLKAESAVESEASDFTQQDADYPQDYSLADKEGELLWKKLKPAIFEGEEIDLSIRFFGVTVGTINYKTLPSVSFQGRSAYAMQGILKSANFYSYIYKLDDKIESLVDRETLLPLKYVLTQRESKKDIDDLQIYDHTKRRSFVSFKRSKNGVIQKDEQKEVIIPKYFADPFSSMLIIRSLPLIKGESYTYLHMSKGKPTKITVKVEEEESIEVLGAQVPSLRLNIVMTNFRAVKDSEKPLLYTSTIWVSRDEYHHLLKFRGKVKIGAIEGEVVRLKKPTRSLF